MRLLRGFAAAVDRRIDSLVIAQSPIIAATAAYMAVNTLIRLEIGELSTAGLRAFATAQNALFDTLLILGLAVLFAGASLALTRWSRASCAVQRAFFALGLFLVLAACVNMQAIEMIGGPLTFQWLVYADYLFSHTAQAALRSALNTRFLLILLLSVFGYIGLYFLFRRLLVQSNRRGRAILITSGAVVVFAFLAISARRLPLPEAQRIYAANPVVEFAFSAFQGSHSDLLTQADAIPPATLPPPSNDARLLPAELGEQTQRNVLLIVLESVGANHVVGTGPPQARNWTPNLARYADRALRFTNIYAHASYSTKALFSLVSGRHPLASIAIDSREFETTPLSTVSSRLKQEGYRTAFFMSGELAFHAVDKFLAGRGFDEIADMKTIGCSGPTNRGSSITWPNLDSIEDSCTARAVGDWIARPSNDPFFVVFWTGNTHGPYLSRPEPRPNQYSSDPAHNRYLAALRASDKAIGSLLDGLARRDLLRDTLVVVVGDHGEAFGEHGYFGHSSTISDDQVRVPLLVIGGGMTQGRSIPTLGALSDVAPTILHLVGAEPEPSWEGRSLFDPHRRSRVMLFALNQDLTFGFREGSRKYIYQVARNRTLVFDLERDPAEQYNVADERSTEYVRRHVAGWLQHQARRVPQ